MPIDSKKELLSSVKNLLGPASAEIGELIADNVRLWRWRRALGIIDRAIEIRKSNPAVSSQISLKFFLPFVEEASKEGDEEISEWWARLLALSSEQSSGFDQACIGILKSIGSREAHMLLRVSRLAKSDQIAEIFGDSLLDGVGEPNYDFDSLCSRVFLTEVRRKGFPEWRKDLDNDELCAVLTLEKLKLIQEEQFPLYYTHDYYDRYDVSYIATTRLGVAFISRVGAAV